MWEKMGKGPQFTHLHTRPDEWKKPGEMIDSIIGDRHTPSKREQVSVSEFRTRRILSAKRKLEIIFMLGSLFAIAGVVMLSISNVGLSLFLLDPKSTVGLSLILIACIFFAAGFDILFSIRHEKRNKQELLGDSESRP
ncbi:MAG: hypothetical protein QW505_03965 [Thermoplasmata archaeon]